MKSYDELKAKRDADDYLTINQYCWLLHWDGQKVDAWVGFRLFADDENYRRFKYSKWKRLFESWYDEWRIINGWEKL